MFFFCDISYSKPSITPKNSYRVIIIGAGMSGLSAAAYFNNHGITNFVVLEGRSHIGGRTWSYQPKATQWGGATLDMGAQWIEGTSSKNPVMKLVKNYRLKTFPSDYDNVTLYGPLFHQIPVKTYSRITKKFENYLTYWQDEDSSHSKRSVSDLLKQFIRINKINKSRQAGLLYEISSSIENEYAADISRLSMVWFNNDKAYPGPDYYISGGYNSLSHKLANPFMNKIKLSHTVKSIDYHKSGHVVVVTKNGQHYEAPYVINTVPIGVLQKKRIQFIPQLPRDKQRAIFQDIGMGVYNKIFLLFPKVFWNKTEYIERVPNAYWNGHQWHNKGRWLEFVNLDKVLKKPALMAILTGDFARKMQSKTKAAQVKSVMAVLRKMFGNKIPNPTVTVLTHWGSDRFSDGSYSSLKPGCLPYNQDYKNMAKPVKGRLIFAGEGTSALYPGTVHGAINSGIRAAKYVIEKLR